LAAATISVWRCSTGGTLYIDDGKPTPLGIAETVRNLRDIAPTAYFNVPKGFEELVPIFRADAQLRQKFFSRLKLMFFCRRRHRAACLASVGRPVGRHDWRKSADLDRPWRH
jgi:hypothetical protein